LAELSWGPVRSEDGGCGSQPARADDLISCLEVVNRHVNGETPSASVGTDKERRIDRRLTYAVAAVITSGVEHFLRLVGDSATDDSAALGMGKELWRVSCAWEMVLAGDIDSLPEHIKLEEQARDLSF
jgi:hypothetical protein